ncbi:MAG TPA: FHA domain-containing protein [Acidimicrobiales bacterium]|nr:FHA domain-containing protein [Acidimicrobiales bacterium]
MVLLAAPSLDNQNLLRALELLVVALIWLFFFRVIRAVWVEIRPPRTRGGGAEASAAAAGGGRRERRSLRLKVIEPEDKRGELFDLGDELTIGRAAGCGVRVDDSYTSALHARLFRRDGTLWVEDLSSTNGTWVNAARIDAATRLGRGDLLQVGGTVFEVSR